MTTPTCPLCGSHAIREIDALSGEQIAALWRCTGRQFSAEAMRPMTKDSTVSLYSCGACGFRFYDPRFAGSAHFYEEMMQQEYYAAVKPEFEFVLRFAQRQRVKRVLDVGGGDGPFLDLARAKNMETFGVELNPLAVARAVAKGHRMLNKKLEEVPLDEIDGGVDLVTLFQVVEHVPNPVEFVQAASRLLRPEGYMAIAVPNEYRGLGLLPYDPANWPPHHVTRWRKKDFSRLAALAGMRVVARGSDILYGAMIERFIISHNELSEAIGLRRYRVGKRFARIVSFLYRKSGCKYFFPRLGLSIYAILQK